MTRRRQAVRRHPGRIRAVLLVVVFYAVLAADLILAFHNLGTSHALLP